MLEKRRRKTKRFKTPTNPRRGICASETADVGGLTRVMHEQPDMVVNDGTVVADMTVPAGHIIVPTHAAHPRFPGELLPVIDAEVAHDGRVKLAIEYHDERESFEIGESGFAEPVVTVERKIAWVLRDKVMVSPITQAIKPGSARVARGRYRGSKDQGAWAGLVRAGKLSAVEGHK